MLISEKSLRRLIREELMRETLREKDVLEEGNFRQLLQNAALSAGFALGSFMGGGLDAGAFAKPVETVGVAASSDAGRAESGEGSAERSVSVATVEENIAFSNLYNKVIDRLDADGIDVTNRQLLTRISSEIFVHHQDEQKLYDFLKICFSVLEKSGYEAFMQNIDSVRELGQKIIVTKKIKTRKNLKRVSRKDDAKYLPNGMMIKHGMIMPANGESPSRWNEQEVNPGGTTSQAPRPRGRRSGGPRGNKKR